MNQLSVTSDEALLLVNETNDVPSGKAKRNRAWSLLGLISKLLSLAIPTFVEKLDVVDWSSIKTCDEPDIAYKRFHEMYTKIYNDCFPLKKATRKQRRFKKNRG